MRIEEATATAAATVHRMMTRKHKVGVGVKVEDEGVIGVKEVEVGLRMNLGVVQAGSGRCGGCRRVLVVLT